MTYSALFTLNPIETVIEIEKADKHNEARRLVERFIITPSLATTIENVALPQLRFDSANEGKGVLIVGNYGTGKSHLMSFLSILAENDTYLSYVQSPEWREKLGAIAGSYKVKRCQIAASLRNLYEIVAEELTVLGKQSGFEFVFKDLRNITNVKHEFSRFMEAFEKACPGKGVLLIIDELLHYLQSRNAQDLVLDLSILQALGEFSNGSRFVFMAGVQQALFNNPRFNFVADDVNRVRQRFVDFVIDSKGVGELIEQYLFQKTAAQREQIRSLVQKQTVLFEIVGPEIDDFVRLFPAHPRFISEFENVFVVERREILKVLSLEGRAIGERLVDPDQFDLITSDKYWKHIEADQGLNANRDVSRLKQNVKTLKDKIKSEFGPNEDKAGTDRLIEALAVNRLTTTNITDEVGLTPDDLKNRLLWHTPIPIKNALFLTQAAKRMLEQTRKAANGQFLAYSETAQQYFINPQLDRDYDVIVDSAAKVLDGQTVQRFLNEIVTRALLLDNDTPVHEGRLWNYKLLWSEKNVERPGWLFFGFPNQRSTAKPPRDFYLFLIPSERITGQKEPISPQADEAYLFFEDFPQSKWDTKLPLDAGQPDGFLDQLRRYAAAREREVNCRHGEERSAYKAIAEKLLKLLAPEFETNAGDWISVQWNGQRKKFREWVIELDPSKASAQFSSKFDSIFQIMFNQHFANKYVQYPDFIGVKVTEATRKQLAQSALEIICKEGMNTQNGRAVLQTLGLYKGDPPTPTPDQSPWLDIIRKRLDSVGVGKILNHSDLFERKDDKEWWLAEGIEAEWLHVTLAAGIAAGDLVVVGPNQKKYDATNLREFFTDVRSFDQIIHVSKPAGIPLNEWRKVFQIFGLRVGTLANTNSHDDAIKDFQAAIATKITNLVTQQNNLKAPLPFATDDAQAEVAKKLPLFAETQGIIEMALLPLNTKAKLSNLKMSSSQLDDLDAKLSECAAFADILAFTTLQRDSLDTIQRLSSTLGDRNADFLIQKEELINRLNAIYLNPTTLETDSVAVNLNVQSTRDLALKAYQTLHNLYRLDREQDKRKGQLISGKQLKQLNRLAHIRTLSDAKLETLRQQIGSLVPCTGATDNDILKNPLSQCPHCHFNPDSFPASTPAAEDLLSNCETNIERLHADWTNQLVREISDPSIIASLNALKTDEADLVNNFRYQKEFPYPISDAFIAAINNALTGLKRRPVDGSDLVVKLLGDGAPLKPAELSDRFEKWITDQVGDDDPNSVRFVLET